MMMLSLRRRIFIFCLIYPLVIWTLLALLIKNTGTGFVLPLPDAALGLLLLVGTMTFMAYRVILQPVKHLSQLAERLSNDSKQAHINLLTGDELESLASSFNTLSDKVHEFDHLAPDLNPLTGLPGINTIHQKMEVSLFEKEGDLAVYIDIAHFKAYNNVYGFTAGDRVIKMTADILSDCVDSLNDKDAFLGHISADDFVIIAKASQIEQLTNEISTHFDRRISTLYNEVDQEKGGVEALDRKGNRQFYPLMTLSMSGVPMRKNAFDHVGEFASVWNEMKKIDRKERKSTYICDRRAKGV